MRPRCGHNDDAMNEEESLRRSLRSSIELKSALIGDAALVSLVGEAARLILSSFKAGGKLMVCGNGGSAADAQHIAAELTGRYLVDRPPLPAIALHCDTSYLTAVANDYGYEQVYARAVRAYGAKSDVLLGLSTSGRSSNVLAALGAAREKGMATVGFTGAEGGAFAEVCDVVVAVPSRDTPRIQECHLLIGHTICEVIERGMFPL